MKPGIWYHVQVTANDGSELAERHCGSLEIAKRAITEFRKLYPDAMWITPQVPGVRALVCRTPPNSCHLQ